VTVEPWTVTPAVHGVHAALVAVAGRLGSDVWVVGGCVRDRLRGRPSTDLDVIITVPPAEFAESLLAEIRAWGRLADAILTGLTCLDPDWPVYRVMAGQVTVDIVPRGDDLESELRRRDLTINAVAVPLGRWVDDSPLSREDLTDPCGGVEDLAEGLVRATSREALAADPVRVLRVARFAVELRGRVDEATAEWVRELAHLLRGVPGERASHELMAILGSGEPTAGELLDGLGLLDPLFPELEPMRGMWQGGYHHLDAREHSLATCRAMAELLLGRDAGIAPWESTISEAAAHVRETPLPGIRERIALGLLAALLHDIGKPVCRTVEDDGRIRLRGHSGSGARMVGEVADRLRLARAEKAHLQALVRRHMEPCLLGSGELPTARAVARLARTLGDVAPDVCLLSLADRAAARGPKVTQESLERQVSATCAVLRIWREAGAPGASRLLTGADVMDALGLAPGPEVGRVLAEVEAARLAGEIATREEALRLARDHVAADKRSVDEDLDDGL
jgi:tRNA nucleotidyltransferase/poly(A) polymerase